MTALAFAAVAVTTAVAGVPSSPARPPLPPRASWHAPAPELHRTASGVRVVVLPRADLPLVHVLVAIQAGSELDPAARPGLAAVTADMLQDGGAGARTAAQLTAAWGDLGTDLKIDCDETGVRLSTPVLAGNLDRALELAADMLARPRFDAREWPDARARRVAEIVRKRDDPAELANEVFHHALYGDHPYGHPPLGTVAAVGALELDEVRAFWAAHYGPRAVTVILVGNADGPRAVATLERALAGWSGGAVSAAVAIPRATAAGVRVLVVDRPGAVQTELRVGHIGLAGTAPDMPAAVLLEMALGGSFTSRLVQNLRERHGYCYSARAAFDFWRVAGPFEVQAAVRTDATAEALKETMAELRAIHLPMPPAELGTARAQAAQRISEEFGTTALAALALSELVLTDQPLDALTRLPALLEALDVQHLSEAANRLLLPDQVVAVAVGDAKRIAPALRALPGVKVELVKP